jgi:hypothetical protein
MDDEDNFTASINLPNGSYDFTAVGWTTAGLTGNPECGFNIQPLGAVVLGGNSVTITIDLATANCANNFYGTEPVSSLEDIYFLSDYTNASGLTKISHIYNQASVSGKFQIHFLEYYSDPAGNLASYSPAISTQCLDGYATDGLGRSLSGDSIQFPVCDGTNDSPFAVVIDIYPLATNCSGTAQRIVFPNGIASPSTSSNPSKLSLTDMGSTPVLFIKD